MHLKKVVKKENKFFIEHYVIADAIDGSNTYYEKLTILNCWKYLHEIACYVYWGWKDKEIQRQRDKEQGVD